MGRPMKPSGYSLPDYYPPAGRTLSLFYLSVLLGVSAAQPELNYMVLLPAELHYPSIEQFCLLLDGLVGNPKFSITVTLKSSGGSLTLFPKNRCPMSSFFCCPFTVPPPNQPSEVATVRVEAKGDISFTETKQVVIQRITGGVVVQTDKAAYKPGDTVLFRITTLDDDFLCMKTTYKVVELKDPNGNRIAQWLGTPTRKCIADLSFILTSDPMLGTYNIVVENSQAQTFIVQEKVLPRFEVTIEEPSKLYIGDPIFQIKICTRYTFGKGAIGTLLITISRLLPYYANNDVSMYLQGKTDDTGCFTTKVKQQLLYVNSYGASYPVLVHVKFTEKDTDVVSSVSQYIPIEASSENIIYEEIDTHYRSGYPFLIRLLALDRMGLPLAATNIKLYIAIRENDLSVPRNKFYANKDTDNKGTATFALDTSEWTGPVQISASAYQIYEGQSNYRVANPFYSLVKSLLRLEPINGVIPCGRSKTVQVQYIIDPQDLEMGTGNVNFYYIVIGKAGILVKGNQTIKLQDNSSLTGTLKVQITFTKKYGTGPTMMGFLLLKNRTVAAERISFTVEMCFPNTANLKFSRSEASPKSQINLHVSSNAQSMCALRAVDKSVQINYEDKELTKELVLNLFPYSVRRGYPNGVKEDVPSRFCWWFFISYPRFVDVLDLFQEVGLKILTNIQIRRPPIKTTCPENFEGNFVMQNVPLQFEPTSKDVVRKYFPDTWLWQLVEIGNSGYTTISVTVPDTITQFNAVTFCIGNSGFGLSPQVSLTVFQPFFIDLVLPYFVIQGETFTLKAMVFNYLKQCLKVKVMLLNSSNFTTQNCTHCLYTQWICTDESTNFNWKITAKKIGFLTLTVQAEVIKSDGNCMDKPVYVPLTGNLDIVQKQLLVKPQGIKKEFTESVYYCLKDSGQTINKSLSLEVPSNLVNESESAYISVTGDVLGTALQNLNRLVTMPYGCGEQNMLTMAPIIYVLGYLSATGQLETSLKEQALSYLESGYQRQLNYKHSNGSYSAFGESDGEGSTWLTAFVIKCFSQAKNYIFIDDQVLSQAVNWLYNGQNPNGCFANSGKLFHTLMKGGVEDDLSLTAYITAALLERGGPKDKVLDQALSCLKANVSGSSNPYTMALMAYTFTLANDTEPRRTLLIKLWRLAVTSGNDLHWSYNLNSPGGYGLVSASAELTAYILLALVSGPTLNTEELGFAAHIVSWLSKQQNPYGGFSSTQDTVVAIQALAKYTEVTFSSKGNLLVTVFYNKMTLKQFKVDKTNRLLLQKLPLPYLPGNYQVTIYGSGCVLIQAALKFNILPLSEESPFSIHAQIEDCETKFGPLILNVTVSYHGSRETTNMVIIEVEMLSGFVLEKDAKFQLLKYSNIKRLESGIDSTSIYLDEMEQTTYNYFIAIVQELVVFDLKPVNVKIYDYYQTEESAIATYGPCRATT